MKKKLRIILVSIIILAAAYLYSYVDKETAIYDTAIETTDYINIGEIVENTIVVQQFVSKYDSIDAIKIKTTTFDREIKGIIYYQITEVSSNETMAEGSIDVAEVQNNEFYLLEFDTIEGCKDQEFYITFIDDNIESEQGITFLSTEGVYNNMAVTVNGETGGTLIMKTVSHIFDVETFLVLMFIIVYMFLFVRLLYRLFR